MTTHPPTWYTTELHGASSWILRHHYTRVALQFPPNLLHHSPSTLATLSTLLGLINPSSTTAATATAPSPAIKLFIVGDTSFSPCCVDEVAAAHYGADCVLHFGHTCMTPTRKLPAYHVLGPSASATGGGDLDTTACGAGIASQVLAAVAAGEWVVLLWDATVAPALQSVLDEAGRALGVVGGAPSTALDAATSLEDSTRRRWASPHPSLIVAYAERAVQHQQQQQQEEGKESHHPHPLERVCGLHTGLDLSHHHHYLTQSTALPALRALYLGSSLDRERSLVGCWGGWFKGGVWRLDPTTTTATSSTPTPALSTALPSHARLLASRYRYVSLIKEAGCVGIVAGTLAVEGHVGMVEALRAALVGAGKGVYVLLVGKLTPAKLANFHGVCDALVLVACPEASLLGGEEAATHAIPIATPHEALVALEELAREEEGRVAEEEGEGQGVVEEGDGGAGRESEGGDDPSLAWDGALVLSFNALLHRLKGSKAWGRAVGRQKPPRQGGNALEQQGQEEAQIVGGVESLGIDTTTTTTTTTALTTQWEGSKALSLGGKGVGEASRRLLTREWRGLAYEVDGSDSTTDIAQGQMGIASRYVGEVKSRVR